MTQLLKASASEELSKELLELAARQGPNPNIVAALDDVQAILFPVSLFHRACPERSSIAQPRQVQITQACVAWTNLAPTPSCPTAACL